MLWFLLALAMFAVSFAGIAWARRRARRDRLVVVPIDLAPRVAAATRAFRDAAPWRPATAPHAPETAAAIEVALIAGDRKRALELAEAAFATTSAAWLAWALVANGQPAAALGQLPAATDGFTTYVRARAEHLAFEHATGARENVPPLITTADLAVLTLASGRGAATWLHGATEAQLSSVQARAAIAAHRDVTARCLGHALDALAQLPGYADAAYLVARLAVKAGLLAQARVLFDELAGRMDGRPDRDAFERDRRDLADPATAVAAAKTQPLPAAAKRSRSLKVL